MSTVSIRLHNHITYRLKSIFSKDGVVNKKRYGVTRMEILLLLFSTMESPNNSPNLLLYTHQIVSPESFIIDN